MKRIISSRNIVKKYSTPPIDRLKSALGISSWGSSEYYLNQIAPSLGSKQNFSVGKRYERLTSNDPIISRIKQAGGKYITSRYGQVEFYFDLNKFTEDYNADNARYNDEYNLALDEFDIEQYKPTDAILKKLQAYRSKGSKVNVKAIKDIDKLLTYYYASLMMGWRDLASAIEDDSSLPTFDYSDELAAIRRKVKSDESWKDNRSEIDQKLGLGDSKGLFTFESSSCWLPKSILQYFIDNNIPVHFGKRTSGSMYDKNGAQWSEIEHLTLYPDSDHPIKYDIAVHTNERADGSIPNTYTGSYTSERVSAKQVIQDIARLVDDYNL